MRHAQPQVRSHELAHIWLRLCAGGDAEHLELQQIETSSCTHALDRWLSRWRRLMPDLFSVLVWLLHCWDHVEIRGSVSVHTLQLL